MISLIQWLSVFTQHTATYIDCDAILLMLEHDKGTIEFSNNGDHSTIFLYHWCDKYFPRTSVKLSTTSIMVEPFIVWRPEPSFTCITCPNRDKASSTDNKSGSEVQSSYYIQRTSPSVFHRGEPHMRDKIYHNRKSGELERCSSHNCIVLSHFPFQF